MELLYGKPIAEKILSSLKEDISGFAEKPHLAVILVGNDAPSEIYVGLKRKAAEEIGMDFSLYRFVGNESQENVTYLINSLNEDPQINGIIVQLPLPKSLDADKVIAAIDPQKDADGFLAQGLLLPVFPRAIIKLLKSSGKNLLEKKALVLANSDEFGTVMVKMLRDENMASQYVLAENIPSNLEQIREADVLVSAVGSPGLLKAEMLKDGAIVIDGGISKVGKKTVGDFDPSGAEDKIGAYSPVPGGVGPVTIACLLENVCLAFEAQQKE